MSFNNENNISSDNELLKYKIKPSYKINNNLSKSLTKKTQELSNNTPGKSSKKIVNKSRTKNTNYVTQKTNLPKLKEDIIYKKNLNTIGKDNNKLIYKDKKAKFPDISQNLKSVKPDIRYIKNIKNIKQILNEIIVNTDFDEKNTSKIVNKENNKKKINVNNSKSNTTSLNNKSIKNNLDFTKFKKSTDSLELNNKDNNLSSISNVNYNENSISNNINTNLSYENIKNSSVKTPKLYSKKQSLVLNTDNFYYNTEITKINDNEIISDNISNNESNKSMSIKNKDLEYINNNENIEFNKNNAVTLDSRKDNFALSFKGEENQDLDSYYNNQFKINDNLLIVGESNNLTELNKSNNKDTFNNQLISYNNSNTNISNSSPSKKIVKFDNKSKMSPCLTSNKKKIISKIIEMKLV